MIVWSACPASIGNKRLGALGLTAVQWGRGSEMVDIPGDNSTTATLTVGGSATGTLEVVGDHDWFKINLTSGQSITVALNAAGRFRHRRSLSSHPQFVRQRHLGK